MKHLFVPYEIAKKLKELGFEEECLGYYDNKILTYSKNDVFRNFATIKNKLASAPLYQQVIDWLREKKIKVVENPKFGGWEIWGKYDDNYIQLSNSVYNIDNAIEEALKLI